MLETALEACEKAKLTLLQVSSAGRGMGVRKKLNDAITAKANPL